MDEAGILRVIIGLVLVVAAILVSAWLARRAGLLQGNGNALLRRVAQLSLGPRQTVNVIEIDNTWLVVGVSANQITLLHTLPANPSVKPNESPPGPASFSAKLGQALKRR